MDHQHDELTIGQLREQLAAVKSFMESPIYPAYMMDFQSQFVAKMEEVADILPDSVTAFFSREQALGEARTLKVFKDWFTDLKESLETSLANKQPNT